MSRESSGAADDWLPSAAELEDFAGVLHAEWKVPGYRSQALLGRGGQGAVLRAVQESTGRTVALKILHRAEASVPSFERFRRERDLICLLQHPSIVTVFDAGVWEERQFLAMELVDGPSMESWLQTSGGAARREEFVRLLLPLCDAMAYAHRQGVIHRDLKPQNVLMQRVAGSTESWLPKVADFGLARNLDGADPHFATVRERDRLSTLAYSAPEMFAEGGARPDTRTDVFGLGAILYRMLAGHDPRQGLTMEELRATQGPAPYRGIAQARLGGRKIGRDLEAICLQAMAPNPEERYATVHELAEDLRRFLEGRPVRARPREWSYVLGKSLMRHRAAWTLGAAAIATAVGGAGAWLVQAGETRRQAERVIGALERHASSVDLIVERLLEPTRKALGSNAAALEVARDLVREREEMLAQDPGNLRLISGLISFRKRVGDLLQAEGRYREAHPEFEAARRLLVAHLDLRDPLIAAQANVLLVNAGDALRHWDPPAGQRIYEQALADDRARLAAHAGHPAAARFASDLAWSLQRVGSHALTIAPPSEEHATLLRARALLDEFAGLHAPVVGDAARSNDVALAETMLLRQLMEVSRASPAEMLALREQLQRLTVQALESDRDSVHYRLILSTQDSEVFSQQLQSGLFDAAKQTAQQAIGHWNELLELSSQAAPIQEQKASALTAWSLETAELPEFAGERAAWLAEAVPLWEACSRMQAVGPEHQRRQVQALLLLAAEQDRRAPPAQVAELFARARALLAAAPVSQSDLEGNHLAYRILLERALTSHPVSAEFSRQAQDFLNILHQREAGVSSGG